MNSTTCTLRVTATDRDVARVSVRRHQFTVGRPIEFDEASPRIAALEYALGAVAGEVVSGLRVFAWRRRVDVDQIEAVVTGELEHALAYLEVVGESGRPRIARSSEGIRRVAGRARGAANLGRDARPSPARVHAAGGCPARSRIDVHGMTGGVHVPSD